MLLNRQSRGAMNMRGVNVNRRGRPVKNLEEMATLTDPYQTAFGKWLRKLMIENHITLEKMSDKIGVPTSSVHKIISLQREPRISTVLKYLDGLNMKMVFVPKKKPADRQ